MPIDERDPFVFECVDPAPFLGPDAKWKSEYGGRHFNLEFQALVNAYPAKLRELHDLKVTVLNRSEKSHREMNYHRYCRDTIAKFSEPMDFEHSDYAVPNMGAFITTKVAHDICDRHSVMAAKIDSDHVRAVRQLRAEWEAAYRGTTPIKLEEEIGQLRAAQDPRELARRQKEARERGDEGLDGERCAICHSVLFAMPDTVMTTCVHCFCRDCLDAYAKRKGKGTGINRRYPCPICRQTVRRADNIPGYIIEEFDQAPAGGEAKAEAPSSGGASEEGDDDDEVEFVGITAEDPECYITHVSRPVDAPAAAAAAGGGGGAHEEDVDMGLDEELEMMGGLMAYELQLDQEEEHEIRGVLSDPE